MWKTQIGHHSRFQSAYRTQNSTETTVLQFWQTFFLKLTEQICLPLFYRRSSTRSIMVFFCIDWTPPIRSCDQYNNGFNPTCQTWLQHVVQIGSSSSSPCSIVCGVPMGSVLSMPTILFLLYCGDLQLIIESQRLCSHLYANDPHIYAVLKVWMDGRTAPIHFFLRRNPTPSCHLQPLICSVLDERPCTTFYTLSTGSTVPVVHQHTRS